MFLVGMMMGNESLISMGFGIELLFPLTIKAPVKLWLSSLKNNLRGFPGGAVVGSLPASAGDTGSGPGLGGSHMPRGGWAREPQLLSLRIWSLCSAAGEAAMVGGPRAVMRSGPRLPQLGRALAQGRRPNTAKEIGRASCRERV